MTDTERNVLGEPLEPCSTDPLTGFFRNGYCATGADDVGRHLVCCEMTAEFLAFSKSRGNDLTTPHPEWAFPGLKPGDRWCLVAPRVVLLSTHEAALRYTDLKTLKAYALDLS